MVRKDDAVSPVVGVMLMLVVTIIIAASVTLFSTDFIGDLSQSYASSSVDTKVNFVGVDDGGAKVYADEYKSKTGEDPDFKSDKISGNIGFVFEVESGDPLDLTKLALQLSKAGAGTTTITYNDLPSRMYISDHSKYTDSKGAILPAPEFFGQYASRMVAYPVGPAQSFITKTLIDPGEKFLIVTEYIKYDHSLIGIRADRLDTGEEALSTNAYNSGGYTLNSATSIKLYNTETGALLYSGLGSDGVWL